jgi:hypothetical protein
MRKLAPAIFAVAALGLLGGCAYDDYHHHHDSAMMGVGFYDGYYDDFYGPFYDGYWGGDGAFYYRDAEGHPYQRDTGGHFRKDQAQGYHPVHGPTHGGEHHDRP